EEALFVLEERKNMAVQTAQMGEWEWEIQSGKILWSEKACRILGISPEASYSIESSLVSIVYSEDLDMVRQQLTTALEGLNVFQATCRIVRADNGNLKWVNIYGR